MYQGRMQRENGVGVMWVQERWWEDGLMIKASLRRKSRAACMKEDTHALLHFYKCEWTDLNLYHGAFKCVSFGLGLLGPNQFYGKTSSVGVNFKDQSARCGSSIRL